MTSEENKNNTNSQQPEVSNKDIITGCGCLIGILLVIGALVGSCCSNMNKDIPDNSSTTAASNPPINKNLITKESFNGEWPFKADSVELYCVDLGGYLTGVKVVIEGSTYAVTRNLEERHTFLPYNEWKDAKMEGLLCNGVYIEKQCKVSLADTVNFANTLCD